MANQGTTGAAPGRRLRDTDSTGARRLGGENKKRSGWLWPLLALLALLLIVGLLLSLLSGGDDDDAAGGGAGSTASLTATGKSLLPVPAEGLGALAGEPAKGKALEVVSVNGNEGFSVAKGNSDPVYVELGGDVGTNEASSFQPKVGQKVNLAGPLQQAGNNVANRLKLEPDDARLVESQGAFVNADRVIESK
jgi:hypothetical protein